MAIEWTNQHGCGGNEDSDPHKLNCNVVLQYMCQEDGLPGKNSFISLIHGRRLEGGLKFKKKY